MTHRLYPKVRDFVPINIHLFTKTVSRWTLRSPRCINFHRKTPIMHHKGEWTNDLLRRVHVFLAPKHKKIHQKRNGWTVCTQMRMRFYPKPAIYQPKCEPLEPSFFHEKR